MRPILSGPVRLLMAVALSLTSCAETYRLQVDFESETLATSVERVDLVLVERCAEQLPGGVIVGERTRVTTTRGGHPPQLPAQPAGEVGVLAIGSSGCEVRAWGCADHVLEERGGGVLSVSLRAASGCLPRCGAGCEAVDAGLDAGSDGGEVSGDGGRVDGGDRSEDAGADAGMRPDASCAGCWFGATCMLGVEDAHCGRGGEECVACAEAVCDVASCREGVCWLPGSVCLRESGCELTSDTLDCVGCNLTECRGSTCTFGTPCRDEGTGVCGRDDDGRITCCETCFDEDGVCVPFLDDERCGRRGAACSNCREMDRECDVTGLCVEPLP